MLTDFGRALRKIRIDCGEIIKDMAEKLGVTASYLSAVETGKRNIPSTWSDEIAKRYNLSEIEKSNLKQAEMNSAKSITFDIESAIGARREAAILFAREFENIDTATIEQIRGLLKKESKEE